MDKFSKKEFGIVDEQFHYLLQMGVKDAFNVGDFDKLTKKEKMKVSAIKHKAVIEVTKEGTTGVAATGMINIKIYMFI